MIIRLIVIVAVIVSCPFTLLQALYYILVWIFLGENLFQKHEPLPFEIVKYYQANKQ